MKEIVIERKADKVVFSLPTAISEFTPEFLKDITEHIVLADHHSLVGLVYHSKITDLLLGNGNIKKNVKIGIVPIFIKTAGSTNWSNNATIGDKVLIASSSLERAYHVAIPENKVTLDYFAKVISESVKNNLFEEAVNANDNREVMFLEFKIVPNCDIIAIYKDSKKVISPYLNIIPNGGKSIS